MKKRRSTNNRTRTRREYTYYEFLVLFPVCRKRLQKQLLNALKKAPRPIKLVGVNVPENLYGISYGTLDDLRSIGENLDPVAETAKILLGINPEGIYQENVVDVFGFANFVQKEVENINKLFSAVKVKYSSEELAAGVKDLDFGSFGVLDWYARRMGITNQNEVRDVAWVRIYNCMKNDVDQNNYERRLQEQSMRKIKHK